MSSRVVFLDYDGVVNTPMWNEQGTTYSFNFPSDGKVNNFQAVQWLSHACKNFGYDIVVTSTWRRFPNYKECLINGGLKSGIQILDKIPKIVGCCRGCRGDEIKEYLNTHPEIKHYIIIDDEKDMLDEQLDYFIQTDGDIGFTIKDYMKFQNIFRRDCLKIYESKSPKDFEHIKEKSHYCHNYYYGINGDILYALNSNDDDYTEWYFCNKDFQHEAEPFGESFASDGDVIRLIERYGNVW